MNTTLYQNRAEDTQNWTNLCLQPHDYRIYYVNIDLRHQYGISAAESQTFLLAKRSQRRRARRNGCFRRLSTKGFIRTCWNVSVRLDRIGIWKCWFLRRGENRSTWRKTSRSKGENQQQTQPTYGVHARIRTRATLVGSERSHHCVTLARNVRQPSKFAIATKILELATWFVKKSP